MSQLATRSVAVLAAAIGIILYVDAALIDETECPGAAYNDERVLLETQIRTEHSFEKIAERLKTLEKRVDDKLEAVTKEREAVLEQKNALRKKMGNERIVLDSSLLPRLKGILQEVMEAGNNFTERQNKFGATLTASVSGQEVDIRAYSDDGYRRRDKRWIKNSILPEFLPSKSNFISHEGERTILYCSVKHLGPKMVVWRRTDEPEPLTIGTFTYTNDGRFAIEHTFRSQDSSDWNLIISNVTPEDTGAYECQITSKENLRHIVQLTVNAPTPKTEAPTPAPTTEAPLQLSACQTLRQSAVRRGNFVPQCEEDGAFTPTQCVNIAKKRYCWCVTHTGSEIFGTSMTSPKKPDCEFDAETTGVKRRSKYPVPEFVPTKSDYTYRNGAKAIMICSVKNLGPKTVVWRRTDEPEPLTIGTLAFTNDVRFAIDHTIASQDLSGWNLIISNVTADDTGSYECQITSKDDNLRHIVHLNVNDEANVPAVAFYMTNPTTRIGKGDTLYFRRTLLGQEYVHNQYFLVPVNGIYMFTVQLYTNRYRYFTAHLVVNNDIIIGTVRMQDYNEEPLSTSGNGVAMLTKGDRLSVRCYEAGKNALHHSGTYWTSFSGLLVHAV